MAWNYDPASRQFYNSDTNQWAIGQTAGTPNAAEAPAGSADTSGFGTWGIGNGQTSYGAVGLDPTKASAISSGLTPEQLNSMLGYSAGAGSAGSGGPGSLTGQLYVNPNAGQWPTQKVESSKDNFFDMPGLALAGLWAGGTALQGGFSGLGSSGAGSSFGGTGGSMFDINDPSTWFSDMTGGENAAGTLGSSGLPPTLPDVPTQWGMPTGGGSGDWWSQYGLTSDPTAGAGSGGVLNQVGSALKSLGMSPTSLASVLGKLGAAGLGALGANQQQNSLNNLAQQYLGFGAPSRSRYEASMTPGFDPTSIPGYQGALDSTSKAVLAHLSATGGNPFGNPGGLIDANKQIVSGTALPAVQEYQRMNANTGFGTSMNAAVPLQTQAIGQQGNVLNSLGYGLNAVTNPQPSLAQLIAQFQGGGVQLNNGMSF